MIVFIIWQESAELELTEPWEKRFFSRLGNKTNAVRLPNLHFLLAYIFHNKLREEWLERSGKSCDLLTVIARRCFLQPSGGENLFANPFWVRGDYRKSERLISHIIYNSRIVIISSGEQPHPSLVFFMAKLRHRKLKACKDFLKEQRS